MSLNKMKILVTGADGFIGKHLCPYLSVKHEVYKVYSSPKRIKQREDIILDLTDKKAVNIYFEKFKKDVRIDIIIHLASKLISNSEIYNLSVLYDNIKITESIAEVAMILKPKKLINFSSIAVYPNIDGLFAETSEIRPSANTDCLYGLSKLCGENILDFLLKDYNISICNLRISQVYGKGMREDRIIPIMLKELKEKNSITVFGEGKRISNFIDVNRLIKIIEYFIKNGLSGIYNIGGEHISYFELAKRLLNEHGISSSLIKKINKGSRVKFYIDTSKIKKVKNSIKK